jgi:glutamate 5-kinase
MQESNNHKRIVVKVGTNLLTGNTVCLNKQAISRLVFQLAELQHEGFEITLVSSGACAAGKEILGKVKALTEVAERQVYASVGQSHLMSIYENLFSNHGITVAQALLTKNDLSDRAGYLNARNTLLALQDLGIICIVNENDVVAIDEIREAKFGDNDNLSAMVANLIDADLLLILSDVSGLFTADPLRYPDKAELISCVERIDEKIKTMATTSHSKVATGGMITKIEAARLATESGISVVIASGNEPDVIRRVVHGENLGTRFLPRGSRKESRQRWLIQDCAPVEDYFLITER